MFWTLTRDSALTIQLKMLWMNFGHFQAQQILANFTPMFHFFMNLPGPDTSRPPQYFSFLGPQQKITPYNIPPTKSTFLDKKYF